MTNWSKDHQNDRLFFSSQSLGRDLTVLVLLTMLTNVDKFTIYVWK